MRSYRFAPLLIFVVSFAILAVGQTGSADVPRVIRYSGTLKNADGSPRAGTIGVSFAIYSEQQGGAPLWQEVHNVIVDETGHYSVLLGSARTEGLPSGLFAANDARWLGIRIENETEQTRVLLAAVPYALKAADAETLGGKPLSSFVLNETTTSSGQTSDITAGSARSLGSAQLHPNAINTAGSNGTQNYLAKWTDNLGTLGNSSLIESGGNIGVNKVPTLAALDVLSTGNAVAVDSSASAFSALIATSNGSHLVSINNMNGEMAFYTSAGEVARFNNTGMGVLKAASLATLDVNGSAAFSGRGTFSTAQPFGGNVSTLHVMDSSPEGANIGGGVVLGGTYTGTSTTEFAAMVASKDTGTDGDYGGGLGFYTRANGSGAWTNKTDARMFITSAGNVGVGTPSPAERLDVNGNIKASGTITGNGSGLTNLAATNVSGTLGIAHGGTGVTAPGSSGMFLRSNGTTFATALIGASDLPTNVALLDAAAPTFTNTVTAAAFNGSGAALTSVNAASLGGLAASVLRTHIITYLGGCDSCSVLTASDNQNLIYQNLLGAALTLVSATCYSDAGTPSIDIELGGVGNVTASSIPCDPTAPTAVTTFGQTTIPTNGKLNFKMTTPGTSTHRVTVILKATL